jgi:hypothetical protein
MKTMKVILFLLVISVSVSRCALNNSETNSKTVDAKRKFVESINRFDELHTLFYNPPSLTSKVDYIPEMKNVLSEAIQAYFLMADINESVDYEIFYFKNLEWYDFVFEYLDQDRDRDLHPSVYVIAKKLQKLKDRYAMSKFLLEKIEFVERND